MNGGAVGGPTPAQPKPGADSSKVFTSPRAKRLLQGKGHAHAGGENNVQMTRRVAAPPLKSNREKEERARPVQQSIDINELLNDLDDESLPPQTPVQQSADLALQREKNELQSRCQALSERVHILVRENREIAARRVHETEAFRHAVKAEKLKFERQLGKMSMKLQDRDALLLEWVQLMDTYNVTNNFSFVREMVHRTASVLPAARNYLAEEEVELVRPKTKKRKTKKGASSKKSKKHESTPAPGNEEPQSRNPNDEEWGADAVDDELTETESRFARNSPTEFDTQSFKSAKKTTGRDLEELDGQEEEEHEMVGGNYAQRLAEEEMQSLIREIDSQLDALSVFREQDVEPMLQSFIKEENEREKAREREKEEERVKEKKEREVEREKEWGKKREEEEREEQELRRLEERRKERILREQEEREKEAELALQRERQRLREMRMQEEEEELLRVLLQSQLIAKKESLKGSESSSTGGNDEETGKKANSISRASLSRTASDKEEQIKSRHSSRVDSDESIKSEPKSKTLRDSQGRMKTEHSLDDYSHANKSSIVSQDFSEEHNIFDNSSLLGSLVEDEEMKSILRFTSSAGDDSTFAREMDAVLSRK